MQPRFLEDEIVPVLRVENHSGTGRIKHLFGTAFFIGPNGIFLTARHVIENAVANTSREGGFVGLNVKSLDSLHLNLIAPILEYEFAPPPYDVAIGKINFTTRNAHKLATRQTAGLSLELWRDVATLGYPESALNVSPELFNINLRSHKGYIQRIIPPGQLPLRQNAPNCFEVSFAIPVGLSGAPLIVINENTVWVVGICVGSVASEIQEYEIEEIANDQGKEVVRKVRIENYGIAEDIRNLVNWTPKILGGNTLLSCVKN